MALTWAEQVIGTLLSATLQRQLGDVTRGCGIYCNLQVQGRTISTPFSPVIVVSREEIQSQDTSSVLLALQSLITSPERASQWFEQIDIAFDGFNETTLELFEIDSVREFVTKLDDEFPFWLFFLSKSGTGLQCIAYCFLPPFLTPVGKAKIFPERLNDLLTQRWFPAMNQICDWVGFSEDEIEALTNRSVDYLLSGPIPDA